MSRTEPGPTITVFNKKIFQDAGEKTPDQYEKDGQWTWDTLLQVGQKLTKGTGASKTFGYDSITNKLHWLNVVVWGYGSESLSRTVDVHVAKLRHKIEDRSDDPRHIVTVHGLGYKFTA